MALPQAPDYVFLKPEWLAKHVIDVIDPEETEIKQKITTIKERLVKNEEEKEDLEKIKDVLDKRAKNSASRLMYIGLTGLACHFALVARLTWWELSWDIVEPITYMITYSTATLVFIYFCSTRKEYNYESFFDRMVRKRQNRLYKRNDFDIDRFKELCQEIKEDKESLEVLENPWEHYPPHANFIDVNSNSTHLVTELPEGEKPVHTI